MKDQLAHESSAGSYYLSGPLDRHDKSIIEKFSHIIETMPDSVITADSEGHIVFCNGTMQKMFGYSPGELLGMPVIAIIPEKYRKAHAAAMEKLRDSEAFRTAGKPVELTGLKKDGTEFPVEWAVSAWSSEGKQYFTCIIRDVTDRKQLEAVLLENQSELVKKHEELNTLFRQVEAIKKEWEGTMDCVGDLIVLLDTGGRIRRCNRAFKEFTRKSYADILGKDWGELLFGHKIKVDSFFKEGVELFHEPTGRWFVVDSYPFIHNFQLSGEAITMHDSTEMKIITEEMKKKNSELEKAYSELKSAQSQLLQQEKMASIGQLAAGVAHEINNPIGFIASNLGSLDKYVARLTDFIGAQEAVVSLLAKKTAAVEALEEKKRQLKLDFILPDIRQLIRESIEGSDRVKKIVQDLKSFSRVDEADHKFADINAGLESTINIVWNELKYKAVLNRDYGDLPRTKCNMGQLNQVFMNLLVNAAQAIEKQGEIGVKTWSDGGSVYISISDTGCGIPEDKLNRIFEPFFTTKEVGKGTGLGLSIAYDIIKKHNGDITVESETGRGTTFTLRIPVVE